MFCTTFNSDYIAVHIVLHALQSNCDIFLILNIGGNLLGWTDEPFLTRANKNERNTLSDARHAYEQ